MEHAGELTMDGLLDDLEGILSVIQTSGQVSLKFLQTNLSWRPHLHLLTYIRFFEDEQFIDYNRMADAIALTPQGVDALAAPDAWSSRAELVFSGQLHQMQHSVASHSGGDTDAMYSQTQMPPSHQHQAEAEPKKDQAPMSTDAFQPHGSTSSHTTSSLGGTSLYSRGETIGTGGIGTVYQGMHGRLQRPVAIKEIRDIFHVFADVQREDIINRFVHIVQTQASLSHANIIQVLDVVTDGEYPFVVMQIAPRGNLRRLINVEGRPPLNVAMRYFVQILHALNTAHDAGVTHGSLKPENIVLDSVGNALLTDFGISSVVERGAGGSNQIYVGVGTVAYMSPEQFRDPSNSTVKSDIYSLGIMFYEMLTGKVPGRRSPMPSSFYPDIPRKLDDIFDRMSMDNEDDRYSTISDILKDIYSSVEVMDILDKRSGVLFLRDPLEFGAHGLGHEEHLDLHVHAEQNSNTTHHAPNSSDVETHLVEDSMIEEPVPPSEDDGQVMDKLDKYGALFDDDDDDDDDNDHA